MDLALSSTVAPSQTTELSPHPPDFIAHSNQKCGLHNEESLNMCFGQNKRGGPCLSKAAAGQAPDLLPTCKRHRDQLRNAATCHIAMACGFPCGTVIELKAHCLGLCERHLMLGPCYFLRLPGELRTRVFEYLLPGSFIPAKTDSFVATDSGTIWVAKDLLSEYHRTVKADEKTIQGTRNFHRGSTSILRVNRQIHDEAAHVLYRTKTFGVEIGRSSIAMCNWSQHPRPHPSLPHTLSNHALEDYQLQLMLLEQQNKRRLMMARQDMNGYTIPQNHSEPVSRSVATSTFESPIPQKYGEREPAWTAPISLKYFNMIRSFHVSLDVPVLTVMNPNGFGGSAQNGRQIDIMLHELCDHLHRLIGRLKLSPKTELSVGIDIKFCQHHNTSNQLRSQAEVLLKPFRRLNKSAEVLINHITEGGDADIEHLYGVVCSDHDFVDLGAKFLEDFINFEETEEGQQVFEEFWKLEKLIIGINKQFPRNSIFDSYKGLLHDARVAREAGDLLQFQGVFESVVQIWSEHVRSQKSFQDGVELGFREMLGRSGGAPWSKALHYLDGSI